MYHFLDYHQTMAHAVFLFLGYLENSYLSFKTHLQDCPAFPPWQREFLPLHCSFLNLPCARWSLGCWNLRRGKTAISFLKSQVPARPQLGAVSRRVVVRIQACVGGLVSAISVNIWPQGLAGS